MRKRIRLMLGCSAFMGGCIQNTTGQDDDRAGDARLVDGSLDVASVDARVSADAMFAPDSGDIHLRDVGRSDAAPRDAEPDQPDMPPVCAAERCNAQDDDCDGRVDEAGACDVVDIATSRFGACAVLRGGSIKCWGETASPDESNPIGDEPHEVGYDMPTVPFEDHAVQVTMADRAQCALFDDGQVGCWTNSPEQAGLLGLESRGAAMTGIVPLPEPSVQVVRGRKSACALSVTGAVRCWGSHEIASILGVATDDDIGALPGQISGLAPLDLGEPATEIAIGFNHACALLETGVVMCWGRNYSGQLGAENPDPTEAAEAIPVQFEGIRATQLFAGADTTCVRLETNELRCWGEALPEFDTHDVLAVRIHEMGTGCALREGGEVACWNAGSFTLRFPEGQIELGEPAVDISLGGNSACARFEDGRAKCWGDNTRAQLALGEGVLEVSAENAWADLSHIDLQMGPVTHLETGLSSTCAINALGQVKCWGNNRRHQLNLGDQRNRGDDPGEMGAALPSMELPFEPGDSLAELVIRLSGVCLLSASGQLLCWQDIGDGFMEEVRRGVRHVYGGNYNRCVITEIGEVHCMGSQDMNEWRRVSLGESAMQLALGRQHMCALLESGSVKCWGENDDGQLGLGSPIPRFNGGALNWPPIDLPARALRIFAYHNTTCALLADETVRCWGDIWGGPEIGDAPNEMGENLPALPLGSGTVNDFDLGFEGYCAVLDGRLTCRSQRAQSSLEREPRPGEPDIAKVAFGRYHVCALDIAGDVTCWGSNIDGQIGLEKHSGLGDDPGEMGDALPFLNLGSP